MTLSKVELLWQILGMGVSVLWLDTDIVNMGRSGDCSTCIPLRTHELLCHMVQYTAHV